MDIYKILKREMSCSFVGKVNILDVENSRHLGVILFIKDQIVGIEYGNRTGENILVQTFIDLEERKDHIKFIVEPETILRSDRQFTRDLLPFLDLLKKYKRTKPSNHLILRSNPSFTRGGTLSFQEQVLLKTLPLCRNVKEIFDRSRYERSLTNTILVSLRNKKAILVQI